MSMVSRKKTIGQRVGKLGESFDRLVAAIDREQAKYWEKVGKEIKDRNRHQRHIIGLSERSVTRLIHMTRILKELKELRTYEIKRHIKDVMQAEMRKVRFDITHEVVKYLEGVKQIKTVAMETIDLEPKSNGRTTVIGGKRFIRDGTVYRRSYVAVEENDLLKFKALLQLEQISFSRWLRKAVRTYVGARFKKLEEIQGLRDTEGEPIFTAEEVEKILEGGEIGAYEQTESKGKKEEVEDKEESNKEEDLGGGN